MGCLLCGGVEFGVGKNKVKIQIPDSWETNKKSRIISVDVCMVVDLKNLWDKGIRTVECCCGHNRVDGYIAVDDKSIPLMLEMGYKNITKKQERKDLFIYPMVEREITASEYCKSKGIKNVDELSEITGITSRRLSDWWHNERKAFILLIDGWRYQKL